MTTHRILVASYTSNVHTLRFDPQSQSLQLEHETETGLNPSWITPYPGDKSLVFAGLENGEGKVVAVKFDETGKGTVAKAITSGGSSPCSLLAWTSELFVANYMEGGVAIVPISPNPPYLLPECPPYMLETSGSGPNKARQKGPHPHQVYLIEEYGELLIADLGSDKVWRFKKTQSGGQEWCLQGYVTYKPGSGPRHVVFHGGYLYTLCELTNTLVKHRLPALPSDPEYITESSTVTNVPPAPDMLAAEILLPQPNSTFTTPYLYVSNRGDPSPEGDIISIFSIEQPGVLKLVNEVRTGLKHVRGMQFGGEDDKWLVVGGLYEGGVKVYRRVADGTDLQVVAVNKDIESPTGFLWL